ncbi:Thimet oligopeptidase [Clydaea vesicula]|uniref:Thimet oligopeptidase n=1 Tax=Clydaea vesicula TaxID=447962 RepID=A0AAD5U0E7_9FUNG|nr:Thimet oligopeptidase [Clydaea vesicula]
MISTNISGLNFKFTPNQVKETSESLINLKLKLNNSVAELPQEKCNFKSVLGTLSSNDNEQEVHFTSLTFLHSVSGDKALRDVSSQVEETISAFDIDQSMRTDLYTRVKYAAAKNETLEKEDKRLLEKTLLDFKRNGLDLDEKSQEKFKANQKKISELSIKFDKNTAEDKTFVLFTKSELEGLDDDFLAGLDKEVSDGVEKYKVTMKYPDLLPVMKKAKRSETRKILQTANDGKCVENVQLFVDTLKLRKENAVLLGYKNHNQFKLEPKMAKTEEAAFSFLESLKGKLKPIAQKELEVLKELKKNECLENGQEFDNIIQSWDYNYYSNMLLEKKYQVDHEKIREYFPMEKVTETIFKLYENVLNVKFKITKDKWQVWHPDVTAIEVYELNDEFLGLFYLDLYPRLQPGYEKADNSRNFPIAAMVSNFKKPTSDKPSLLNHNEVVTFYHELGHVMHNICSKTKWARFHGTAVERDFVEAPSQMLENWCWETVVLKKLSSHYKTGESLPDDLIKRLVDSKKVGVGLANLRQIFFGSFDLEMHSTEFKDPTVTWERLRREVSLIPMIPSTVPFATFGHLMHGYDSGYYGYLWSEVFSADMYYSRFEKEDSILEGKKAGMDYRTWILKPGGSIDGMDMLKGFLGREPNDDAFLKTLQ